MLSFLATIDNFSIPAFLGISSGIPVLSTYIYEKAIGFGPSSFSDAAVLSVLLSLLAIGGALLEGFFVKRSPGLESVGEDASTRIELTPKVRAAVEWSLLGGLFAFNIVPLLFMALSAMQKRYGLGYAADNLTVENFRALLTNAGVLRAVRNSLLLASVTCAVCIVVGTAAAYLKVRRKSGAVKVLEKSASLAYAIPGIVLALSMIFHWVEPIPGVRPRIYGTIGILAVAYVTRYLVLQIKGSVNAMLTVEPALEEAARAGGSGAFAVWLKILVPLLAKPVLASAFLVFIPAMTELTLSSILSAAGTKTIGLTVFNFQQAGDYSLAAAMSAVVVLIVLGGYGAALAYKKLFERQKEKKNETTEAGARIPLVRPDAGAR
jgi:iron(III) transport system permease protein